MSSKKTFSPSVITANTLGGGDVVYLGANRQWTRDLTKALLARDKTIEAELTRMAGEDEKARLVVAVYSFPVKMTGLGPQPVSVRERIRSSHGPSPEGLRKN